MALLNKKSYISLLFLLAYSVLLLHSIIPHHHEDNKVMYQAGYHDDEGMEHTPISHALSFFQHNEGSTLICEAAQPNFRLSNINTEKAAILLIQHFTTLIEKPPLIHFEQYHFIFLSSPYSTCQRFRGPPSILA